MTYREFDLLILDLAASGRCDLELLKRLRACGSLLPVLVLTSDDSVEECVKYRDSGADDSMTKPLCLQDFEARVRGLIPCCMGVASISIRRPSSTSPA